MNARTAKPVPARTAGQSTAQMRKLTVAQALADKEDIHLFVMNIQKPDGNINLTVKGDDGTNQSVVIPKTFIPLDMGLFINRENMLNNQIFRRLVARGDAVVIVNTEDAINAIENNPSAKKELKRILSENNTYQVADEDDGFITMKASGSAPVSPDKQEVIPDLSPFAMGIVQQAGEPNADVADLMLDIEGRLSDLSMNDLEFICASVEDASLKQWIVDKITQR